MVQWCNGILFQWYNDQWKEEGKKRSVSKIFGGVPLLHILTHSPGEFSRQFCR